MAEIKLFDKPIIKKDEELEKGDVIETPYGDEENIIQFVLETSERQDNIFVKQTGHYPNGREFEGWKFYKEDNKVVGKEVG